ncbi:MAG: gluconate 2-dehydrogenase subunit 3 family protein [Solirubrobacteraceae bacterium]
MTHDFSKGEHLPKRLDGRPAHDPYDLPRQRRGVTPQMHGRYPEWDVLEQAPHWDEVTRDLVLERARTTPPIRFFDAEQARTLEAFCNTVTAQDSEPRVPVLAMVDKKLHEGKLDGYRYHDMPKDTETWKLVARGLDEAAAAQGAGSFAELDLEQRREVCGRVADGKLAGGVWEDLPCSKAWSVVMRAVLSEFYSHPWAWNEIGYAGPAYPRGYMRMNQGEKEPYEADEAVSADPVGKGRQEDLA